MSSTPHPNPHVHEQFDDPEQQHEAGTLGMWTFLATEVLFFGAMLTGYTAYRLWYNRDFAWASHEHMYFWAGAINTAILLCSSLTVALSVHAAKEGNRRLLLILLLLTIAFGVGFLGVKTFEYTGHIREHLAPGYDFHPEPPKAGWVEAGVAEPHVQLFFVFYWILTGIHATHLIIGIGLMAALAIMTRRGKFSPEYYNPVEIGGLYWHFVDVVWIFLFPLLYMVHPA